MSNGLPVVKISPRGAGRLRDGHVWVYRSDVVRAEEIPPGSLVSVVDTRARDLGTALYSSSSQIAIRMMSNAFVKERYRPHSRCRFTSEQENVKPHKEFSIPEYSHYG